MSRIFLVLFLSYTVHSYAQKFDEQISSELEKITAENLKINLSEFEKLGFKTPESDAIIATRQWLIEHYKNLGLTIVYGDTFDAKGATHINIIAEKIYRENAPWIILNAHYDTRGGAGVNDNGTGVVTCMELARVLQANTLEHNIRIIHFDAEELGLLGSKHYVANSLKKQDSISLVLNLDQLGGTSGDGYRNQFIVCERDENFSVVANTMPSWRATDTLAQLARVYTNITPIIDKAYSSDYIPFELAGYTITGLYQFEGEKYPGYHNTDDKLERIDVKAFTQVAKLATSAVLYFGRMVPKYESFLVYPNPAKLVAYIQTETLDEKEISVFTSSGELVLSQFFNLKTTINTSELPCGAYFLRLKNKKNGLNSFSKLIIAR